MTNGCTRISAWLALSAFLAVEGAQAGDDIRVAGDVRRSGLPATRHRSHPGCGTSPAAGTKRSAKPGGSTCRAIATTSDPRFRFESRRKEAQPRVAVLVAYSSAFSRRRCSSSRFARSLANRVTPAKIDSGSRCASAITSASSPPVNH